MKIIENKEYNANPQTEEKKMGRNLEDYTIYELVEELKTRATVSVVEIDNGEATYVRHSSGRMAIIGPKTLLVADKQGYVTVTEDDVLYE